MNAAELIAYLQDLPPETPVVFFDAQSAGHKHLWHPVRPATKQMYRVPGGSFSFFESGKLQHRNDTMVVNIGG
jgi:hypothetical protein